MNRIGQVVLLLTIASAEPAAASEVWRTLFSEGRFQQAARLARAQDTDVALAFAARSTLAHAMLTPMAEPVLGEAYHRAEADARRALRLNPSNVEASLQLAIALGHRAKLEGPWSPKALELARAARQHIGDALRNAPENAWAKALSGAWHMTVSHHAGEFLGQVFLGSSWARGKAEFRAALARDPDNLLLLVYFAEALQLKSAGDDLPIMERVLQRATRIAANNHLEQSIQGRAEAMLRELQTQEVTMVEGLRERPAAAGRQGNDRHGR